MIAVPIGPRRQRFATAGAPAYLAARSVPAHPRELVDHGSIRHRFASGTIAGWELVPLRAFVDFLRRDGGA